jgi:phosphoglycerate dehydrogenase-like enzyme/glyoxylase-like metal-dependent hydrolase (beta-lactamase superfamily II)
MGRRILPFLIGGIAILAGAGAAALREVVRTEPNQVVEIAPGVYFRHGDLEGNGHCNHGIVVFRDFVLVIDGNFPSGAEACLKDVKAITDKPVRFVFNTHHHGDHAYGNPVWLKNGVIPIAHQGVANEMARLEPKRWQETKRPDVTALNREGPQPPLLTFPDRMVLDDGTQRVEFLHFGTAHTRGDGFAYLPRHKVLFTGDAVVNGPYNFMGDGDTASWIRVIDALKRLDVEIVGPGHGPLADRSVLDRQRRFIVELRGAVAAALGGGKGGDLAAAVHLPEEVQGYVGQQLKDQVAKVERELVGLETPFELVELGFEEGPSPRKEDRGWTAPRKVVLAVQPQWLGDLQAVAPGVKLVAPRNQAELAAEIADADAVLGRLDAELYRAAKNLRWFHSISAGVNQYVGADESSPGIPGFAEGPVVLTNGKRCYGPNIADQVFAYLLAFTRKAKVSIEGRLRVPEKDGPAPAGRWKAIDPGENDPEAELRGKTLLVVGAGGIGSEVARRAESFGMRVLAIDPKVTVPPRGVGELHRPADLMDLLPRADVLVLACPFTKQTSHLIGQYQIDALKRGAYLINVARGPIVDRGALLDALRSGKLAGAGLDVTDPEPLPDGDPLWTLPNVIITPHNAGQSDGSQRRIFLLARENVRRFAAGEPLLNVVDKKAGY